MTNKKDKVVQEAKAETEIVQRSVRVNAVPGMSTITVKDRSNLVKLSKMLNKPILHMENSTVTDQRGSIVAEDVDSFYVIDEGMRYMVLGEQEKKR